LCAAWILKDIIKKYDGKVVGGILVTESGILAAAHLGGAGSVSDTSKIMEKKYQDAYGTSIQVTWKHLEDMILHQ
jgi:hypothetical protein